MEGVVRTRWDLHSAKKDRSRSQLLHDRALSEGTLRSLRYLDVSPGAGLAPGPSPSPSLPTPLGFCLEICKLPCQRIYPQVQQRGFIHRYSAHSEETVKLPQRLQKLKRRSFTYQTLPRNRQSHHHKHMLVGKGRAQRPSPSPQEVSWNIHLPKKMASGALTW